MLSIATDAAGDVVHLHADIDGVRQLEQALARLRAHLEADSCQDAHFFSEAWGGGELTVSMLDQERQAGWHQVHHLKLFGWSGEWARRHGLRADG